MYSRKSTPPLQKKVAKDIKQEKLLAGTSSSAV
jgi:hypothetical protein